MLVVRNNWRALAVVFIAALLMRPVRVPAEPRLAAEYEVKAAFLYNFSKYVEWPPGKMANGAMVVGLIGDDPFQGALDHVAAQAVARGHPLIVRRLRTVEGISECTILFIGASEEGRLTEILQLAAAANVLTVSDMNRFVERGGMIGFQQQESKIRFAINTGAARHAGLTISSQLLKLASNVLDQSSLPTLIEVARTEATTRPGDGAAHVHAMTVVRGS